MSHPPSIRSIVLALIVVPGCSLPRGPINIDPLVPQWLAHGEVNRECPDDLNLQSGAPVDDGMITPPVPKFHPVPTRPVFEPAGTAAGMAVARQVLTAGR
jgi:hypothetical protein